MESFQYSGVKIFVNDSFNELKALIEVDKKRTCFLVDANVYEHWFGLFDNEEVIIISRGEEQKSLSFIETIIDRLIEKGLDRNSQLVGLGGGVVCDITGFVASIYMRGIDFVLAPTTLLAMADASIGGKNGVNTKLYKNMIGVINQPKMILCCTSFLKTLPNSELCDGMVEIVKHACISNASLFEFIESKVEEILALDDEVIEVILKESIKIKCSIVEQDPYEKGERKKLNYGHTYGHAIEKEYQISHGKAVSLGIVVVNILAVKRQRLSSESGERIIKLLQKLELPVELDFISFDSLERYLKNDKKKKDNMIDMIFLEEIGHSIITRISLKDLPTFNEQLV